jgi:hypothetical protein
MSDSQRTSNEQVDPSLLWQWLIDMANEGGPYESRMLMAAAMIVGDAKLRGVCICDKCDGRAVQPPRVDELITLSMIIGSDNLAITFQSMAQYRTMLLKTIQDMIDKSTTVTKSADEPKPGPMPCPTIYEWDRDNEATHDLLSLVDRDIPLSIIESWTDEQCHVADEWAGAAMLQASDNDDIEVPPIPDCVRAATGEGTAL